MLDINYYISPFNVKNLKHGLTQICVLFYMIKAAVCDKMTEYKVVQNAGISLTKGACVTLEVKYTEMYKIQYTVIGGSFQTHQYNRYGPSPPTKQSKKRAKLK